MEYSHRTKGCKTQHGDIYTGEYYQEEGLTWYVVTDGNANTFETTEQPVEVIDLTRAVLFTINIPDDYRIYNKARPDGTFPSLDGFFTGGES